MKRHGPGAGGSRTERVRLKNDEADRLAEAAIYHCDGKSGVIRDGLDAIGVLSGRQVRRAAQADLMTDDPLEVLRLRQVHAVYSDPPWGQGNLTYWRTKNGQAGQRPDWRVFLQRFADVCRRACPTGPVWIETGLRFEADLISAITEAGFPHLMTMRCRYRAGSKWLPNLLCLFGDVVTPDPETLSEEDRYGIKLVTWALSQHEGASVLDPCCGLGTTARAAVKLGRAFFGTELNESRLARTQAILERAR